MADWLVFEEQCTQYLNDKFGDQASFCHLGSADSTVPDIRVETKSGKKFYMDAKLAPAQCGQFVLLPDVVSRRFVFSKKNKTALTPQVQTIMEHMNADFEAYKEAGTAGKEIDLHDGGKVFAQWIVSTYLQKGACFFITNGYTILPTCDFPKFFNVTATYRVKRSGSGDVGKRGLQNVIQHIKDRKYPVSRFLVNGGKLFVESAASLHNTRFVFDGFEYMFSARGNQYEIRKLSNTFNANVIFQIEQTCHTGLSDEEFESCLH